jgi:hypothetical protein
MTALPLIQCCTPLARPSLSEAKAIELERERRGTFAYYRVAPGALERVSGLLAAPPAVGQAA